MAALTMYLLFEVMQDVTEKPTLIEAPCAVSKKNLVNLKLHGKMCFSDTFVAEIDGISYLLSPEPFSAEIACSEFCAKVVSKSGKCKAITERYEKCTKLITPKGCNSTALPVAYFGSIYYYVMGIGEQILC